MPTAVEIRPHDIKQVIVHPDDARHHRVSVKIQNHGVLVRRHVGALLDRRDLSALNHDILIFDRRCSGAVNNPHVREDNLGSVRTDELLHRLRQFRSLGVDSERSQQQHEDPRQKARWHENPPQNGEHW